MNPEQKVAYEWAKNQNYQSVAARYAKTLADLIDSLTTQLSASQRREQAAVEELAAHAYAHAASCKHYADCYKVAYAKCAVIRCASCDKYDFCGPQEAGEGKAE